MVQTASTMLELGTFAPAFCLEEPLTGRQLCLQDLAKGKPLLVMFLSNHCPFVKHIRAGLARFAKDYSEQGVQIVAINANDVDSHPDDSPEKMKQEVLTAGYVFPYLFDAEQSVAKAYKAACTPDFFLFDGDQRLVYRGQFDASRPGNNKPVTGEDLRQACDAVLGGRQVTVPQHPSIGCNIKWRSGNEPDYFLGA